MATPAKASRDDAVPILPSGAVGTRSVGEAARALGISPSTVRNWIAKGYIHAFRLPSGIRRIPHDELTRLVNEYFAPAPVTVADDAQPELNFEPSEDEPVWGPIPRDSSDRPLKGGTAQDHSIDQ